MVKITGTLHIDTGFVRLKPNINFIGAKPGISVYALSQPLEIELNPTPAEGLYLVDYCVDINSGFYPMEHWIIPGIDCTFDQVRGVNQVSLKYVQDLEEQIVNLKLEIANLKQDATYNYRSQASIDILKRFS